MYGQEPKIPLDHLLNNLDQDWGEEYVKVQADLMDQAYKVARHRMEKSVNLDKIRHDRKDRVHPLKIGDRVILQKTGFRDRHKLQDHFCSESYVATNKNSEQDLYEIRLALGGPTRWVNRRMLIRDPRDEFPEDSDIEPNILPEVSFGSNSDTDSSSDSDPDFLMFLKTPEMLPVDEGVDNDNLEELPPPVHPVTPRRSSRTTRGQHSNPFNKPHSVNGQEL